MGTSLSAPKPEDREVPKDDDIAVVGMACRFPGSADSPEHLWDMLIRGESAWSEFPKDRINIDGFYHPGGRQGSIPFRGAHFLKDDIAAFDAPFFGISAEEAKAVDPQQRFLLEVSYEALENGGMRKEDIDGRNVSVFVGSFVKDYEQVCLRDADDQPRYAATGNGIAIMANRLSYFYNIHGASMTIDTGCSASLVCIHQAAETLRQNQASIAIAAGSGMILTPNTIMPMTALNFLSKDGKCFTFDHRANGYGRGEGVGVVVMKRLVDAIRDNDPIRAVIRASRLNQDGRSQGITHPSVEAQISNIQEIYTSAGLDYSQTAYVECHGTGTQAGDITELQAIGKSIATTRDPKNPLLVGSIKPNIGHLEGSAGIAGMIKSVLVLENGIIPPNIHFEKGNPGIKFKDWKIKVPTSVTEWPITGLRRVSVNCFGFGGTNAHVILDQAPEKPSISKRRQKTLTEPPGHSMLVTFSGHCPSVLRETVRNHVAYLKSKGRPIDNEFLHNYAFTQNCRRSALKWRAFVVADDQVELIAKLEAHAQIVPPESNAKKKPKIAFAFCGQGSQFPRMCLDLIIFKTFHMSLKAADGYFTALGSPFSLMSELRKPSSISLVDAPEISQPATTAVQVAVVDLLRSFGIQPDCVVGHSSGEVAAAYAAGLITRRTAWAVAYYRGAVAGKLRKKAPKLDGGMLAVQLSQAETREHLKATLNFCEIACINSPTWTTVSGSDSDLIDLEDNLRSVSVHCVRLSVQLPYHSSHMNLVANEYTEMLWRHEKPYTYGKSFMTCMGPLQGMMSRSTSRFNDNPQTEKLEMCAMMYSSLTGGAIDHEDLSPSYWALNMTSPVRFTDAVAAMYSGSKPDLVVEVSPKATLKRLVNEILADVAIKPPLYAAISKLGTSTTKTMLEVAGQAWTIGSSVSMETIISEVDTVLKTPSVLTDLPSYPWDHSKTYWHESHLARSARLREHPRKDLLGSQNPDSVPFEPRWRSFLRVSELPWLHDHQVQKTIVYPAAGMAIQVIEAASQMVAGRDDILGFELTNFVIFKAMMVPETTHGLEVALNMKELVADLDPANGEHEFSIFSKQLDGPWRKNASGNLHIIRKETGRLFPSSRLEMRYHDLQMSCTEKIVPRQLYDYVDDVGLNYGPTFQNVTQISRCENACVYSVRIPDTKAKMPMSFEYDHVIHPATLDAMFHALFAVDCRSAVPSSIRRLFVCSDIQQGAGREFHGFATAARLGLRDMMADIVMTDHRGFSCPSVIVEGLGLTDISPCDAPCNNTFLPNHRNLCTEIKWQKDPAFCRERDLLCLVRLMAHRHSDLAVLQIDGNEDTCIRLLSIISILQKESSSPSLFISEYAFVGFQSDLLLHSAQSYYGKHGHNQALSLRSLPDNDRISSKYNIILYDSDGCIPDKLFGSLEPGGVIIHANDMAISATCKGESWSIGDGMTVTRPIQSQVKPCYTVDLIFPLADGRLVAFAGKLAGRFFAHGVCVRQCSLHEHATNPTGSPCVYLAEIDGHNLITDWDQQHFNFLHQLQTVKKQILWLTRSCQIDVANPRGAAVFGLARTLMSEDSSKRFVTMDIGDTTELDDALSSTVYDVFIESFFSSASTALTVETEYAERDGCLFVPRLSPITVLNRLIEEGSENLLAKDVSFSHTEGRLRMEVEKPGLVRNWFSFEQVSSDMDNLEPGEVEVDLVSSVLLPVDFATVMGRTTKQNIGSDIEGKVTRVASNSLALQPGDDVVVLQLGGTSFVNRLRISADSGLIRRQLFSWSGVGLIIPSCHIAAYYGLLSVGELEYTNSPTVLIHAGASAHGQASIQIAALKGVRILTTVIGDDKETQRLWLSSRPEISPDCILDGDHGSFAAHVLELTGGKGVSVVLDPTGDLVEASFDCVQRSGRIIHLSKHAVRPPPIRRSPDGVTIFEVDLVALHEEKPRLITDIFEAVWNLFSSAMGKPRTLQPLGPRFQFTIPQFDAAFATLEKHLNHGIVTMTASSTSSVPVKNKDSDRLVNYISKKGVYVLVGGFGGLGLSIAEFLVRNGSGRLAFISRSGPHTPEATDFVNAWARKGVQIVDCRVDVKDGKGIRDIIGRLDGNMGGIQGVIQCAAVIKDSVFENMTFQSWRTAFEPKAKGSWNIVKSLEHYGLGPWIIFLSSSSGVIGNRAQANYAAGNTVQDSLAAYWNQRGVRDSGIDPDNASATSDSTSTPSTTPCKGRPGGAVSLDLGPIIGAGMLVDDDQLMSILRGTGFFGIRHHDFLTVLEQAIKSCAVPASSCDKLAAPQTMKIPHQVVTGVGTGGLILQNQPPDPFWSHSALYGLLRTMDIPRTPDIRDHDDPDARISRDVGGQAALGRLKERLTACTTPDEASKIISNGLLGMLAKSMNMLPEEMDPGRTPNGYGVDSLVAVGVRGWVAGATGVNVSVLEVVGDWTVGELAVEVARRGGFGEER